MAACGPPEPYDWVHTVLTLDAGTGELRSSVETDSSAWTFQGLSNGRAYADAYSFRYFALDDVADGVVYVGTRDGFVRAVSAGTGEVLWRRHMFGAVNNPPTVVGGAMFVSTSNGWVYALDTATGDLLWRYRTDDTNYLSPTLGDEVIFVLTINDVIYALEAEPEE